MEIGNQAIQTQELTAGIQEDAGVTAAGLDFAVFGSHRFQSAAAGGADGNNSVTGFLGLIDESSGLLTHTVPLRVHQVILNLVLLDRAEGTKAHMQGNLSDADPLLLQLLHQFRGEMQTCGGCRCTAQFLGVYGLVLTLILQLLGNIRRKRHLAELVQLLVKGLGVILEGNQLVAVLFGLLNRGNQGAVAKQDAHAGFETLTGARQALPNVVAFLPQQKQLTHCAGVLLLADQTGGQHLGIVHHQKVARLQEIHQIPENTVLDLIVGTVQAHQPGGIAGAAGFLRNQFLRQVEPEIFFQHRNIASPYIDITCRQCYS